MSKISPQKMTVEEFLAWGEGQFGRHELVHGQVHAMSPERVRHLETKAAVYSALAAAVRKAGAPCRTLPDGATIRIDAHTAFEPDAMVRCGPSLPGDTIEIPDAVIVAEILSARTRHVDTGIKFTGYFRLASIMHYLVIDPDARLVTHHRRDGDAILTRILASGRLRLDPPGLDVDVASMLDTD